MVWIADSEIRNCKKWYYDGIWECPINGTVDGARSTRQTNNRLTERERKAETRNATKKHQQSKRGSKERQRRREKKAAAMVWDIYLEATAGEAMAFARFASGRLQGLGSTAVCRNMQRLKYESAGELEV